MLPLLKALMEADFPSVEVLPIDASRRATR